MSKMERLGKAYKKFDNFIDKGLITSLKERFSKAKKPVSTSKALTVFDPKKALPASASKFASATKKAGKFGKLRAVGRVASRVALPVAAGFEAANLAYKVATLSPEKKAKIKKLKTNLKKTSTKDYHADLMKMSTGGDTMIKNKEKADLDKDGKLSKYEKKRGKAIESNMMKANMGMEAKSTQGYGAARTSGMGLQDENLIPGKSMDYYKDIV